MAAPVGNFSNIQTHYFEQTRTFTSGNFILAQTVTIKTVWARHTPVAPVPANVLPPSQDSVPAIVVRARPN